MKKLLSTLCTIIFIFTALSVVVHAASPSLTISTDNNVVKPGDTVQIKVFLNDNPGLYALCFEIPIDPNAFAYDGCEYTNSIFKLDSLSDYDPTTNSFKLNRCGESLFENVTEDGIVCTVKLKIKDSATSGEYDIRINPDHSNTINVDGNSVNIDGGGINITVNAPCKHTLKEVYAVPATCKTVGTIKHYHCTKCNRLFLDDTGTKEINDITEPINSNNHVGETEIKNKKEASCTEEGYTGDTYCKSCGAKMESGKAISKLAHTPSAKWEKDNDKHWHICTVCNTKLDEGIHNYEWTVITQPTEESEGLKKGVCSVCGCEKQETIPALEHTHKFGEEWKNNGENHWHECKCGEKSETEVHGYIWTVVTEATEEFEGLKKGVCSVCSYEKHETIPKLEHTHKFGEEWKNDGENHWHECKCGEKSDTEVHDYKWTVVTEATEESEGLKNGICSVCGYEKQENISKLSHEAILFREVPADCSHTGTCVHWHCSNCNKNFEDEACTKEIEDITLPIEPENHVGEIEIRNAKDATYTEKGYTGDKFCVSCGELIEKGKDIPMLIASPEHNHYSSSYINANLSYHIVFCSCGESMVEIHKYYLNGVCVCGAAKEVTMPQVPGSTETIEVTEPIEPTDVKTEDEETPSFPKSDDKPGEESNNPKTGTVITLTPMVIALCSVLLKKK